MKTFWCFLSLIALVKGAGWKYSGATGPENWGDDYPFCSSNSQSPIDITAKDAVYDPNLPAFTFSGYNSMPAGATYTMKNDGHVVVVSLAADQPNSYTVSGGGLPTTYNAAQFHFHWGSNNDQGSEHTVNEKAYPMEVHIVHYSSQFQDLTAAVDKARGLAVLGFFFEIGDHNEAFDAICDDLKNVTYKGGECALNPFDLFDMLPGDLTSYWRYSGSLTTPPCYESVIWTVFQQPIVISEDQMAMFRDLYFESENENLLTPMVNTYRPVEPVGHRTVFSSTKVDPNEDPDRYGIGSATSVKLATSVLSLTFIALLL